MTRRKSAAPKPLRVCLICQGPMPERRPVFVVADTSGMILGPFHSGCAAKLVERARSGQAMREGPFELMGKLPLPAREETLPW